MRRAGGGRVVLRTVRTIGFAAVLAVALAACGASDTDPTTVPTFPVPPPAGQAPSGPGDDGRVVPTDCGRILAAPDLEALLGLPLGSVALRTTIGVAEPSVGRTERVTCDYSRTGEARRSLLDINATAYRDPAAAAEQWRVNVDASSGVPREVPLGSARAALFERDDEAMLMIAHATSNLTLVLPDQPLPAGRDRADVLIDLALRVLPAVTVEPTSGVPEPVPQAGASR